MDEFEEADEFDEEMEVDEEDEGEEEEEDSEEEEEEEDSFDNSDQDNSEEEEEEASESGSSDEDEDEDAEMARQEAAIAAATAAAERKALRKAERWAMAVGATFPLPRVRARPTSRTARSASARRIRFSPPRPNARVRLPLLGSLDTVRKDVLSPSKRVAWNLKRNTRHTPTGPPNPVRGEGLRALLGSTPTKGLLRPIHAAKVPLSDPRGKKTVGGKSPGGKGSRAETMTPGRRRAKASDFF